MLEWHMLPAGYCQGVSKDSNFSVKGGLVHIHVSWTRSCSWECSMQAAGSTQGLAGLTNSCTLCQALATIQVQHRELGKGALGLQVTLLPLIKRQTFVLRIIKGSALLRCHVPKHCYDYQSCHQSCTRICSSICVSEAGA